MAAPYFPLFVNLTGKRATIIGGGDTACRKAKMLLDFGAVIHVVAPEVSEEMAELIQNGSVFWLKASFSPEQLAETDLLIAATNFREVNRAVYEAAREQLILVHVCDKREECSFLFPAVVRNESVVAGAVTLDDNLLSAKKLAKKILEKLGALR